MADPRPAPSVVVVGGANLDIKARSTAPVVAATSNPGTTAIAPGGVGRNIAENLARLGTRTHLVAAVGKDALGDRLLADTAAAGVLTEAVRRTAEPTGTYTAVLDEAGELVVAIADMAATDALAPDDVDASLIASADVVVLDGNLAPVTAAHVLGLAAAAGVRVLVDPVSVPKAARLAPLLDHGHPVFAVTPNLAELAALTGLPIDTDPAWNAATAALHERGAELVWVRLGPAGSLLSGPTGGSRLPAYAAEVVDVTGAGDAMLGAFCHALLGGATPAEAGAYGHAAAAATVASPFTVRPDLSDRLVRSYLP